MKSAVVNIDLWRPLGMHEVNDSLTVLTRVVPSDVSAPCRSRLLPSDVAYSIEYTQR